MRSFPLFITLSTLAVCSTFASRLGHTLVRRGDHVHSVSHGPYVFEAGAPPSGIDLDLYHRIVQRSWDMVIQQEMGESDVLYAVEHSHEFADRVTPELLNIVRSVVQCAVDEAKKKQSSKHEKRSSSSSHFVDVDPNEDRYMGMVYAIEKSVGNSLSEGKISRSQYDTLRARIGQLYRLPRSTTREMGRAILQCAQVCSEIEDQLNND